MQRRASEAEAGIAMVFESTVVTTMEQSDCSRDPGCIAVACGMVVLW